MLNKVLEAEKHVLDMFADGSVRDSWGVVIDRKHVLNYLTESRARYVKVLSVVASRAKPGSRVLDIGTAYGIVPLVLSKLGYAVSATDLAENIPVYGRALASTGAKISAWDICTEEFPHKGQTCDVAVISEVLEHLPAALSFAVRKIASMLGPKGVMLATTPNLYRLPNIISVIRGKNICEEFTGEPVIKNGIVVDNRCHPREPVAGELTAAAKQCGLDVVRLDYFNTAPRGLLKNLAYSCVPKSFKDHILIVAAKQ